MKVITTELTQHLASDVVTLATCWKLTMRNSIVKGFTDHDSNIVLDGITYAAASGMTPSAVASSASLSVDNMDIAGVLDSTTITEADIQAGLYDFAEVTVFMVNYRDLSQEKLNIRQGWLGEVNLSNQQFVAEVRGLMQSLSQGIGGLYSPLCRAKFGDSACGVSLVSHTVTGAVTSIVDNRQFTDSSLSESTGHFNFGVMTLTSGSNQGIAMEVKSYDADGSIRLVFPMPYAVSVGDTYSLHAGCDKTFATCISRYSNAVNFRGEPHVPGVDKMLETSTTRS
jgi:uncharacterized phage protein (TIGR02218 family)